MNNQIKLNDLANCFWYITRMASTMPFMRALVNELLRLYKKCGERVPEALSNENYPD